MDCVGIVHSRASRFAVVFLLILLFDDDMRTLVCACTERRARSTADDIDSENLLKRV